MCEKENLVNKRGKSNGILAQLEPVSNSNNKVYDFLVTSSQVTNTRTSNAGCSSAILRWECLYCTYQNTPEYSFCEICGNDNPTNERESNRLVLSDIQPMSSFSKDNFTSSGSNIRVDNDNINSKPVDADCAPVIGNWKCLSCTFRNPSDSVVCQMCDRENPSNAQIKKNNLLSNLTSTQSSSQNNFESFEPSYPIPNNRIKNEVNAAKSAHVIEQWICLCCTYQNTPNYTFCEMCGNDNPANEREPNRPVLSDNPVISSSDQTSSASVQLTAQFTNDHVNNTINARIVRKICQVFSEEVGKKTRLLDHLSNFDAKDKDLEMLEMLFESTKDFKDQCEHILSKIGDERNEQFALNLLKLAQHIDLSKTGAELAKWAEDNRGVLTGAGIGLTKFWCSLPPESQKQVIVYISKWSAQYASVISYVIPNSWSLLPKAFGPLSDALVGLGAGAEYILAPIYLTAEASYHLYRWYYGEISGAQAAKNITDSIVTVTTGLVGGAAGAATGSAFGPIGTVIGGIIGAITCSWMIGSFTDSITREIFKLPRETVVEDAYGYLGVSQNANTKDVNDAYKKLCLKHHPDKGGSKKEFLKLQYYMGIIKVDRGETFK